MTSLRTLHALKIFIHHALIGINIYIDKALTLNMNRKHKEFASNEEKARKEPSQKRWVFAKALQKRGF